MVCMKWKSGTNRKYRKRGMLTVEASLLIPLAVLSVGIMISLSIFSYQRCWYTQAGCETVLAGSTQGVLKNSSGREQAEARWNVLQKECYPRPQQFSSAIGGGTEHIQAEISGVTPVWGRNGIHMEISVSQKVVRPVKFIRKIAALAE